MVLLFVEKSAAALLLPAQWVSLKDGDRFSVPVKNIDPLVAYLGHDKFIY